MATLNKTRAAQWPLVAEFTFNFNDRMVPLSGGTAISGTSAVDFGETNIVATSFGVINLPPNAVVIGGDYVVETAFDAATYAVIVGDATSTNRYLTTADRKALGRTALVPTGYVSDGGTITIGITNADVCTTGKATLRVMYTIRDRANEVNPT